MSKRAEERAFEAYPINIQATQLYGDWDMNKTERDGFTKGYEQAEKDLGWISVKERLPEKEGWYFTCIDYCGIPQSIGTSYFDDGKWWRDRSDKIEIVDYWMQVNPLPLKKEQS